ncbi:IclR family transcriptional regulator, partial [Herbaspirillum frisingense]
MTRLHDMPHEADEADDGAKAQAQRGIQSLDSTGALLEALLEAAHPLP